MESTSVICLRLTSVHKRVRIQLVEKHLKQQTNCFKISFIKSLISMVRTVLIHTGKENNLFSIRQQGRDFLMV